MPHINMKETRRLILAFFHARAKSDIRLRESNEAFAECGNLLKQVADSISSRGERCYFFVDGELHVLDRNGVGGLEIKALPFFNFDRVND